MSKKSTKETFPDPPTREEARMMARVFLTGCALAGELAAQHEPRNYQMTHGKTAIAKWSVELADATLLELDL